MTTAPLRKVVKAVKRQGEFDLELECGHSALHYIPMYGKKKATAPKSKRCHSCLTGEPVRRQS